jgi:hypothetical protein
LLIRTRRAMTTTTLTLVFFFGSEQAGRRGGAGAVPGQAAGVRGRLAQPQHVGVTRMHPLRGGAGPVEDAHRRRRWLRVQDLPRHGTWRRLFLFLASFF